MAHNVRPVCDVPSEARHVASLPCPTEGYSGHGRRSPERPARGAEHIHAVDSVGKATRTLYDIRYP
jgi:hypothetical protein